MPSPDEAHLENSASAALPEAAAHLLNNEEDNRSISIDTVSDDREERDADQESEEESKRRSKKRGRRPGKRRSSTESKEAGGRLQTKKIKVKEEAFFEDKKSSYTESHNSQLDACISELLSPTGPDPSPIFDLQVRQEGSDEIKISLMLNDKMRTSLYGKKSRWITDYVAKHKVSEGTAANAWQRWVGKFTRRFAFVTLCSDCDENDSAAASWFAQITALASSRAALSLSLAGLLKWKTISSALRNTIAQIVKAGDFTSTPTSEAKKSPTLYLTIPQRCTSSDATEVVFVEPQAERMEGSEEAKASSSTNEIVIEGSLSQPLEINNMLSTIEGKKVFSPQKETTRTERIEGNDQARGEMVQQHSVSPMPQYPVVHSMVLPSEHEAPRKEELFDEGISLLSSIRGTKKNLPGFAQTKLANNVSHDSNRHSSAASTAAQSPSTPHEESQSCSIPTISPSVQNGNDAVMCRKAAVLMLKETFNVLSKETTVLISHSTSETLFDSSKLQNVQRCAKHFDLALSLVCNVDQIIQQKGK